MTIFTLVLLSSGAGQSVSEHETLTPGFELLSVKALSDGDESLITILRIDPHLWDLVLLGLSQTGGTGMLTSREWCEAYGLTAGTNAGMFATDYRTHIGYARFKGHINNDVMNDYKSIAVFDPVDPDRDPWFGIVDLDNPGVNAKMIMEKYGSPLART